MKELQVLQVTFRIVTPLFLSGVDQKQAELRLPSVKGALRYWYRAINPHFNQWVPDAKNKMTYEEELFGSARKGIGQGKFLMRTDTNQSLNQDVCSRNNRNFTGGVKYLSFSMKSRRYIKEDQTFTLYFALHPSVNDKESLLYWRGLMGSLWLLGHVGGLGLRSRRGFGTIALEEWSASEIQEATKIMGELPIAHHEQTIEEWQDTFHRGLDKLHEWFTPFQQVDHTVIDHQTHFYIGNYHHSWSEALHSVGNKLKEFRDNHKEDRLSLGLPMIISKTTKYKPEAGDRVASPVWVRVIRIGKQYYTLYMLLSAPYPRVVKEENDEIVEPNVDISYSKAMENFRNYLESNGYQQVFRVEELSK